MLLTLSEFANRMNEAREFLEEKLLTFNNGKQYGQVVFLAGGAGSGKGFATKQFMDSHKFKIRDVDEMKRLILKSEKFINDHPELRGLNLKNPDDVFKLHQFVSDRGFKDKSLELLLTDLRQDRLPNIMFDITAKSLKDITKVVPLLQKVGYEAKDTHIVWILTNYYVAAENNKKRERVVPEDILLKTHVGAARTMSEIAFKNAVPRTIVDGGIYVILNNPENTIVYTDKDGNKIERQRKKEGEFKFIVKSFTYMTLKKPGKAPENADFVKSQLVKWISDNAPDGWQDVINAKVK